MRLSSVCGLHGDEAKHDISDIPVVKDITDMTGVKSIKYTTDI
jgi:hypothetical protein